MFSTVAIPAFGKYNISMKNACLVLVNKIAGGFNGLNVEELKNELERDFDSVDIEYLPSETEPEYSRYSAVVVCGGDGTLNHLINSRVPVDLRVYYLPSGTLNEAAHIKREEPISVVGEADGKLFSYVLAAGTFTPLGYSVGHRSKQRFRALAYIARVIAEYKVSRIGAVINADGAVSEGEYTLIMAINSPRCFGFKFNRMYREGGDMCLLTIKAPRAKGIFGKIAIFFPFFRSFFIGFSKPYKSKNIGFGPFKELKLDFDSPPVFCADGERADGMSPSFTVRTRTLPYSIRIGMPESRINEARAMTNAEKRDIM